MMGNEDGTGSHRTSVALDSADFPALGSRLADLQLNEGGESRELGGFDGLREDSLQYSSHLGQMQEQHRQDFAIQKEDFPALPGFNKPVELPNGGESHSSNTMFQHSALGQRGKGGLAGAAQHQHQQSATPGEEVHPGSSGAPGSYPEHHFGLLGLLGVLRVDDEHKGKLALGTDLTSLGLNLNSSEPLYINFKSPFADRPPVYVPACYSVTPPGQGRATGMPIDTKHFSEKYTLETLFYIFYAMPKDAMQVLAAKELYARQWSYHMEMQLWFQKAAPKGQAAQNQSGSNTQYIYFDVSVWDRRLFTGTVPGGLEAGFMKREASTNASAQQSYPQQPPTQQ